MSSRQVVGSTLTNGQGITGAAGRHDEQRRSRGGVVSCFDGREDNAGIEVAAAVVVLSKLGARWTVQEEVGIHLRALQIDYIRLALFEADGMGFLRLEVAHRV